MNKIRDDTVHKWTTKMDYIDLETGELITKSEFERNYFAVRKTKIIEFQIKIIKNEKVKYGIIKHNIECRRTGQQKLF